MTGALRREQDLLTQIERDALDEGASLAATLRKCIVLGAQARNADLRDWLQAQHYCYVLAVACDEAIGIQTTDGRKRVTVAQAEALLVRAQDWQRVSMGQGTKGPRFFDWACVPRLAPVGG